MLVRKTYSIIGNLLFKLWVRKKMEVSQQREDDEALFFFGVVL